MKLAYINFLTGLTVKSLILPTLKSLVLPIVCHVHKDLGEYIKVKLVASLLHSVPFAPCLSFICIRRETQRIIFPTFAATFYEGVRHPSKPNKHKWLLKFV
jgi:hypothetical protein